MIVIDTKPLSEEDRAAAVGAEIDEAAHAEALAAARAVIWTPISKGDPRGREIADRHYTRQRVGHPMWTRPGYSFCLLAEFERGRALWCWWRPKWESGLAGTRRRDGLECIECTMFRREGHTPLASDLIRAAVAALGTEEAIAALRLDRAGAVPDGLVTSVSSSATAKRRSSRALPGHCFRCAGWETFDHAAGRADVWLQLCALALARRGAAMIDAPLTLDERADRARRARVVLGAGHITSSDFDIHAFARERWTDILRYESTLRAVEAARDGFAALLARIATRLEDVHYECCGPVPCAQEPGYRDTPWKWCDNCIVAQVLRWESGEPEPPPIYCERDCEHEPPCPGTRDARQETP